MTIARSLMIASLAAVTAAQDAAITRRVDVTLTEGTSMAAAVSPNRRWIAIDLLGALWILPASGGEARRITPELLEARLPAWSPDSNALAFQGYDDGTWHVYVIGRDGSNLKTLTSGIYDDREPAWSHDGSRIAFSSDRATGTTTIWTVNVASGDVAQASARDGWNPAWSADDREIAFVSADRAAADRQRAAPGVYAVGDGRERLVLPNDRVAGFAWTPDGRDLAFTTVDGALVVDGAMISGRAAGSRGAGEDVFPFRPQWVSRDALFYTADGHIMRRESGATSVVPFSAKVTLERSAYQITHRPLQPAGDQRLTGIVHPVVSADGRAIAFTALGDLWIAPAGGSPIRVTDDPAVEVDPAWSPDGTRLAYSSDRGGQMELWVRDLRTKFEARVARAPDAAIAGAAWSPDGNHLAYVVDGHQLGVATLQEDGHAIRLGSAGVVGEIGRPTWSADNRLIAVGALFPFSSRYREGFNEALVYRTDAGSVFTSVLFRNHSAGNRQDTGPVWSPDGTRIAFVTGTKLWTVAVDGSAAAINAPSMATDDGPTSPSWEGDGRHIVYQTAAGLRRVIAEGGPPEPIDVSLSWRAAPPPARVVVHAGALFDGVFDGLRPETDIVIENGVIRAVETHRDDLHTGTVVDAANDVVMPGLIEMHAHLNGGYGSRFGRVWLAYGVTTVRLAAVQPFEAAEQRESFESGRRAGPRLFSAGDPFDGERIYYPGGMAVGDEQELERALDRAAALDLDFFKTYVRLPDRFQKRVVEFAHAMGRPVTSHELYPAVAFGADGVEHLRGTSRRGYSPKLSATNRSYADVIDLLAKSGMTLTPTIGIQGGFAARVAGDRSLLSDERLALYPADVVSRLAKLAGEPPDPRRDAALKPFETTIVRVAAAGGRIIAGTDAPIDPYGLGLHAEIEEYVHAGLTPFQALQTATVNAAQALGAEQELGSIQVGRLADLAFVAGDPLADIRHARNVTRVMRGGRLYTVKALVGR